MNLRSILTTSTLLGLLALPASAAELVRNGNFASGMTDWVKPPELGSITPVASGALNLQQPGTSLSGRYYGPIVSQGLNVTGIAGETLSASIRLAQMAFSVPPGYPVSVSIDYLKTGGVRATQVLINPAHTAYGSNGVFNLYTGSFTFPPDAVKLVKVSVSLLGQGIFRADDLSLSGPFTAGPVPVINSLSATNIAYGSTITLDGTGFGATAGLLTVGPMADHLVVDSWSDTQVQFHLVNPHHGGLLHLENDGVMASQNFSLAVTSPHFTLSIPDSHPITLPGEPVDLDAWLYLHNGYTTTSGIVLAVPSAGSAASFSPLPVRFQGGTRLHFDTTGLAAGSHSYTVTSMDGTTPGNSVPLVIDVRTPTSLALATIDPNTGDGIPVSGTLTMMSYATLQTSYQLLDGTGTDLTRAGVLTWQSSNPAVLQVVPKSIAGEGPTLVPHTTSGTCTLTASHSSGFTASFPVSVEIPVAGIASIGFANISMDNSGTPTNHFEVTADPGSEIGSILTPNGINTVSSSYGNTSYINFTTTAGLGPGLYQFTAQTSDFFSPAQRSAMLTVTNAAGTGMISGWLARFDNSSSGTLDFHHPGTGALLFSRIIGADGVFTVGAIPPGSYLLHFRPANNNPLSPVTSPWYPNAPTAAWATPVTITANQTVSNIHFFVTPANQPTPPPPVAAAKILSTVRTGNSFTLSYASASGLTYRTEYTDNLASSQWLPLDTRNGDGSIQVITDSAATGNRRFYRVVTTVTP